jgi:c-di-AMP phosphodiesterase-like protein
MRFKGTMGRFFIPVMIFAFIVLVCNTAVHFVTGEAMRVIAALLVLVVFSFLLFILACTEKTLFYVFTEKSLIIETGRLPFLKRAETEILYENISSFKVLQSANKAEIEYTHPKMKRPMKANLKAVKQDEFVKQFEERLNVQGD